MLSETACARLVSVILQTLGVIKQILRKYVNGAIHCWDDFVNVALWASRVRVHSTTGFSPFYLAYGREPRLPGDIWRPYITPEVLLDNGQLQILLLMS